MKRYLIFLTICMTCAGAMEAQTLRDYVRRGNRLMSDTVGGSDFSEKAIIQYRKAMEIDSTFSIARHNLGNALIRQGKPQDAMAEFQAAAKYEKDKKRLSDIYHNMGVLLQASKEYAHAVECYKESLRNDPSNDETRYNYVLAKWHLKNQQNENQNGEDNKEDKQEQQKKDLDNINAAVKKAVETAREERIAIVDQFRISSAQEQDKILAALNEHADELSLLFAENLLEG